MTEEVPLYWSPLNLPVQNYELLEGATEHSRRKMVDWGRVDVSAGDGIEEDEPLPLVRLPAPIAISERFE